MRGLNSDRSISLTLLSLPGTNACKKGGGGVVRWRSVSIALALHTQDQLFIYTYKHSHSVYYHNANLYMLSSEVMYWLCALPLISAISTASNELRPTVATADTPGAKSPLTASISKDTNMWSPRFRIHSLNSEATESPWLFLMALSQWIDPPAILQVIVTEVNNGNGSNVVDC